MMVVVMARTMMMPFAILLLAAGGAQALPWDGATPTHDLNLPLRYQDPPRPTALAALRARQAPGDITCAWEGGGISSMYLLYCASQKVCATNSLGAFGCCNTLSLDDCPLQTTCIDSTALDGYSSSYGVNNFALSCTNAQLPYCIAEVVELDRSVTGWACDSTSLGRTELYYSTYWNASATSTRTIPTYHNAVYLSYTTPSRRTTTTSTSTTSTTSSISSTTSTSTTSSSTVPPTPTPTAADSSSTPVGAIVGGAVGGAAVIAGIALLAYYLVRRSKRQNDSQTPYTGGQPPMAQPQSPPPPAQYVPYPGQPGYVYGGQPPAQPLYYPEKTPGENTTPVLTTSDMGSPASLSPNRTSTVPSYAPMHELG